MNTTQPHNDSQDKAKPSLRGEAPQEHGVKGQKQKGMNKSLERVVDKLLELVDSKKMMWHNPCIMSAQKNAKSGKAYRGINQFLAAMVKEVRGYKSPYWATFNQIRDMGGKLENAKGAGIPIIFFKELPQDEDSDKAKFVARHSCVFNLDLVTGIDLDKFQPEDVGDDGRHCVSDELAARYLDSQDLRVSHGSPAYSPALDIVYMPARTEVKGTDEYYSVLFHELAHSTGHPKRLARFEPDCGRFESREDYSKEELVAEITSAMLCHLSGVDSTSSIENSAAYLQSWGRFIRDNKGAFATAIQQADKAKNYILGA
ncbi:MAG: ArdC family protein [Parahaliea sp.]